MYKILDRLLVIALVLLGVVLGGVLWKTLTASGAVDYCYAEVGTRGGVNLMGHRDWRPDRTIGVYHSAREAVTFANEMGVR